MNEDKGYVKVYRSLLDWEWWHDINVHRLFSYILLKANWKDKRWQGVEIKRGEFVTSLDKLSKDTDLTTSQVRTALEKLQSSGEVIAKSGQGSKHTIIRVCKYEDYQERQSYDEVLTTKSQDNDKVIAKSSQSDSNSIATTNKERIYKNSEEKKKESGGTSAKPTSHAPSSDDEPTLEEVAEFVTSKKLKINPENFYSYYASRGWKDRNGQKVTNWRMMLIHWNLNQTEAEKKAGNNNDDGWLE